MANLANLEKGRGWNSTWTPEREAVLRELWADGVSYENIARRLSLAETAVSARGRKIGLPARENNGHAWTDEQVECLKVLWEQNLPLKRIGAELGFYYKVISRKAKKLGLPERPPQPHSGGRKRKPGLPKEKPPSTPWERYMPGAHGRPLGSKNQPKPPPVCLDGRPTILDLRSNQCKYAIGERDGQHIFCGDPSFGSWCPAHRHIVFRSPT